MFSTTTMINRRRASKWKEERYAAELLSGGWYPRCDEHVTEKAFQPAEPQGHQRGSGIVWVVTIMRQFL